MTPHPVDITLARAQSHLAGARYAQAVGAFRAAVGVGGRSPKVVHAHLGLALALSALGRRQEAVAGLVGAAEGAAAHGEHHDAMRLWSEALAIDPSRMELHLDLAMVEEAMGRHADAVARLEALADRFMDAGRYDEAGELLRMLAAWEEDGEAEAPVPAAAVQELAPRNTVLITGETVIALNPLLAARAPVASATAKASASEPEPDVESRITLVHGGAPRSKAAATPTARPASRPVSARPDVVERLRARAGLGRSAASPRRASVRVTEPISIRGGDRSTVQDEDVTRYFRRPQGLPAAS